MAASNLHIIGTMPIKFIYQSGEKSFFNFIRKLLNVQKILAKRLINKTEKSQIQLKKPIFTNISTKSSENAKFSHLKDNKANSSD